MLDLPSSSITGSAPGEAMLPYCRTAPGAAAAAAPERASPDTDTFSRSSSVIFRVVLSSVFAIRPRFRLSSTGRIGGFYRLCGRWVVSRRSNRSRQDRDDVLQQV